MKGNLPVDVICVCNADGQIRPLRLRLEDEAKQLLRINIDAVLQTREIHHVGAEAQIFLCRARIWGCDVNFELKYAIRSHSWSMSI